MRCANLGPQLASSSSTGHFFQALPKHCTSTPKSCSSATSARPGDQAKLREHEQERHRLRRGRFNNALRLPLLILRSCNSEASQRLSALPTQEAGSKAFCRFSARLSRQQLPSVLTTLSVYWACVAFGLLRAVHRPRQPLRTNAALPRCSCRHAPETQLQVVLFQLYCVEQAGKRGV